MQTRRIYIVALTAAVLLGLCVQPASAVHTRRGGQNAAAQHLTQAPVSVTKAHKRKPVLGSKDYWPDNYDRGFGRVHPKVIFNGGDPSGLITGITWKKWGAKRSHGKGKTAIFKPRGGYYPGLVRAEVRAQHLSHCSGSKRAAYTKLFVRIPSKPGGKLGKWFSWSGTETICARSFD